VREMQFFTIPDKSAEQSQPNDYCKAEQKDTQAQDYFFIRDFGFRDYRIYPGIKHPGLFMHMH
jgi:hypothetical protein